MVATWKRIEKERRALQFRIRLKLVKISFRECNSRLWVALREIRKEIPNASRLEIQLRPDRRVSLTGKIVCHFKMQVVKLL